LIAYRGWDDDFDTDFGFQGKLQYLVGLRDPQIADQSESNGFESDNDGSGSVNTPRTSPEWWNVTIVGPKPTASSTFNSQFKRAMHLRRSSQNKINNTLILGWPNGILIDGVNTTNDAASGTMYVKNTIIAGVSGFIADTIRSNGTLNALTWFNDVAKANRTFTTAAEAQLVAPFDLNNPNFLPISGSPALTGAATPPSDGFFNTAATFVGAFGSDDWTFGWARFKPENTTTGVNITRTQEYPRNFELSQNYPNPFNPTTTISYSLPTAGNVVLKVYNLVGQEVATLVDRFQSAGTYRAAFDAGRLSSGVYFYTLKAGNLAQVRKMMLLK
jgi:hypothetical protein